MNDNWITPAEAAALTGYKEEYVRQLVRSNKGIKSQKFGHAVMIDKISLLDYYKSKEARR